MTGRRPRLAHADVDYEPRAIAEAHINPLPLAVNSPLSPGLKLCRALLQRTINIGVMGRSLALAVLPAKEVGGADIEVKCLTSNGDIHVLDARVTPGRRAQQLGEIRQIMGDAVLRSPLSTAPLVWVSTR